MKQEVDVQQTNRAAAFKLWMQSPMPMVTLVKTIDISKAVRVARHRKWKINMLLCWCIGQAATGIEEFFLLPEQGMMYRYDRLAINVIVRNEQGGISSCDIPFTSDIEEFNRQYLSLTQTTAQTCQSHFDEDSMVVGTSAMITTQLDCIVNQYTNQFVNPMVMWGQYRRGLFRTTLPISFQFHHVQMDGGEAAQFLQRLQQVVRNLY